MSKSTKTSDRPKKLPPYPVEPFTALAVTKMRDVSVDAREVPRWKGKPEVLVTDLLDRYGRHCRRWGDEPPVLLDTRGSAKKDGRSGRPKSVHVASEVKP